MRYKVTTIHGDEYFYNENELEEARMCAYVLMGKVEKVEEVEENETMAH